MTFLIYIHLSGYCLFKVKEFEEIGHLIQSVRSAVNDIKKFSSIVKLQAFCPFKDTVEAYNDSVCIKENKIPDKLLNFLDKCNFNSSHTIGFECSNLVEPFKQFGFNIVNHNGIQEITRYIKQHICKILKSHHDSTEEKRFLKSLSHKIVMENIDFPSSGINITNGYNLLLDIEKHLNFKKTKLIAMVKSLMPELIEFIESNNLNVFDFFTQYFNNNGDVTLTTVDKDKILLLKQMIEETLEQQPLPTKEIIKNLNDEFIQFSEDLIYFKRNLEIITKKMAPNMHMVLDSTTSVDLGVAKIIAAAGSLKKLAELPNTAIHSMTFKNLIPKKENYENVSKKLEEKIKSKTSKLISNKLALASRIDFFSKENNTSISNDLNINQSLQAWTNKKGIHKCEDENTKLNRIKKLKMKRKLKKKKWLQKKRKNQILEKEANEENLLK